MPTPNHKALWEKVTELTTLEEVDQWIKICWPLKGIPMDFRGVRAFDTDVYNALVTWREDREYLLERGM